MTNVERVTRGHEVAEQELQMTLRGPIGSKNSACWPTRDANALEDSDEPIERRYLNLPDRLDLVPYIGDEASLKLMALVRTDNAHRK